MKVLLDEHFSRLIADALRELGFDAVAATERAELRGRNDFEFLEASLVEHRAVVTENVADFAALARRLEATDAEHYGLIFTAGRTFPRTRAGVGPMVEALAALMRSNPGDDALAGHIVWLERVAPATT